jgi:SAM-dependent methyltransferase
VQDDRTLRAASLQLVAASFVTLVQELALIRWLPGQVRVLAYFSNIVLISAFVGLGIGCLLADRNLPRWTWPASLFLLSLGAFGASRIAFTSTSTSEHLWLLYFDLPKTAPVVDGVRLPILAMFVLSAITFVPLGHFIAARLRQFQEAGRPLAGYALDLAGSLLGVITFAAVSYAGTFPVVWFAIALVAGLLLYERRLLPLALHAAFAIAVLATVFAAERASWYSPYYALGVKQEGQFTLVLANGSLHQAAMPLRKADRVGRDVALVRSGYHVPYRLLRTPPKRVLVIGAGTGNDVAVALDNGAEHVDAVEIDPKILDLGRRLHPDRPYASPRVRTFNTDARSFLNDHREQYDLIVFGTLDSMTRLSALSSVRLDNFVYTTEAMQAARRHLAPGGGIALYFMVKAPFISNHIGAMLVAATHERPVILSRSFILFNTLFLSGPAFDHLSRNGSRALTPEQVGEIVASVDVPTDNWPYLYLSGRTISPFYGSLIAAILGLTAAAVFAVSSAMRRSAGRPDVEMFLFGAAFLMVESKLVTEMNLVWGATWLTSAVVFGSILLMILAGTILTAWRPLRWNAAATALILSLAATYFIPIRELVGRGAAGRLAASIAYVGLPVFFASICFAILFREREHAETAFGWNMLGAVFGGLLEFSSMALGLKAITLLAIVAYLVAILYRRRNTGIADSGLARS